MKNSINLFKKLFILFVIIFNLNSSILSKEEFSNLKFLSDSFNKNKNNNEQLKNSTTRKFSCYYTTNSKEFKVTEGITEENGAIAVAEYTDSAVELGWDKL